MFESISYENKVHKVLKKVAQQRIAIILPGNVPVIERCVGNDEATQALLLTAQIRGWVDVLYENLPTGKVDEDGHLSAAPSFANVQTHWKLTDSGWAAIQRRHQMALLSLFIGLVSVLIGINA
ncbi:hypothetical protein [Shewanella sp. 1180_01]|uniref:hypothetical protein n=1 Tax=Shewanella sp. 1180_01 TaxID=2604451 RepID=UPI0040638CC1